MDIEFGNINQLNTNQTGWFVGFSEWTKDATRLSENLRHVPQGAALSDLCVKWMFHPKGDTRGLDKPISVGRTMSILVSNEGGFDLEYSTSDCFSGSQIAAHSLSKQGDFVIWGAGLFHRSKVQADSTILTIRWENSIS